MTQFLFIWQNLIAGGLGLLAGIIAFAGVLIAANRQIAGMRRAADQEVATVLQAAADEVVAIEAQIADRRARDEQLDKRRRRVIEWVVTAEGRRLEKEIARVRPRWSIGSPYLSVSPLIESRPLLRGEREDAALLDDMTFATLEEAAHILNDYNHRVETATTDVDQTEFRETCCKLLDDLAVLAAALQK